MTYTQNRSKKLWKNKNMCPLYIYIYSNSTLSLLQFPILAMPLPKIKQIFFFFSSYFDNAIATNQLQHFFSSFYFDNAIATNSFPQFFPPLFRQCHCHKPIATIFFPSYFGNAIATNPFHNFFFFFLKK